jgi:hypothetical protein
LPQRPVPAHLGAVDDLWHAHSVGASSSKEPGNARTYSAFWNRTLPRTSALFMP